MERPLLPQPTRPLSSRNNRLVHCQLLSIPQWPTWVLVVVVKLLAIIHLQRRLHACPLLAPGPPYLTTKEANRHKIAKQKDRRTKHIRRENLRNLHALGQTARRTALNIQLRARRIQLRQDVAVVNILIDHARPRQVHSHEILSRGRLLWDLEDNL